MTLRERIISGARAMLFAQLARTLGKGIAVVLLTRVFFTPEEYGLLFYAISILGIGVLFANLGLAKSAGRYLTEYRERDPGQLPHILAVTFAFNLATIAVVGGVLFLFGDAIAAWLGEPRLGPLLRVGVVYVAALSLKKFVALVFQGFNRVTYSALVEITSNVGLLSFLVAFLVLDFGVVGALVAYTAGYALSVCVGLWVLYAKFVRPVDRDDEREAGLARRILTYSIPLTATRGASVLDRRVDTILVGYFMNPVAVGYYTLGKQVSGFVIAPAASLGFSVAPTYGEQKARDDLDRAARLYETTVEYVLALYVPAAVGLFLVADPVVRLVFGTGYLGAVPVLQVFALYVLLRALDKITNDGLDFLGRARDRAIAKGGTSVANFGLNLVLIPMYGVVGAAVATVATYSVLVAIELAIVGRELPVDAFRVVRTVATIVAISAGMGLVVSTLVPFAKDLATLAAVVVAGLAVWATLSTAAGILDPEDVRAVLTR